MTRRGGSGQCELGGEDGALVDCLAGGVADLQDDLGVGPRCVEVQDSIEVIAGAAVEHAAARRILAQGDAAIEPRKVLLDDEARLLYEGSKEAMVGHRYAFRVKDAAAYFAIGSS